MRLRKVTPVAVLAALALTSCSGVSDASPPSSATLPSVDLAAYQDITVLVDPASGQFVYPIDAYLMPSEDLRLVDYANDVLMQECVTSGGGSYVATAPTEPGPQPADRRYGLWDVSEAAEFGYAFNVADFGPETTDSSDTAEVSDATSALIDSCIDSIEFLPSVGRGSLAAPDQDPEFYLAADIMNTAYQLSIADARWKSADDAWEKCLIDAGVETLHDSEGVPVSPVVPDDPEQSLRTAVTEAECSASTDRVQTLGDIESQYQAALIDQQQSALNASLEEQSTILDQAKEITQGV